MSAIGRELNYQEYLHKERIANYNITNLDIFKPKGEKDKAYQDHLRSAAVKWFLPAEQKREQHIRYFHSLVAQPFVKFLQELVELGVNAHATVGKLEFYRKLDDHKKHLLLLGEQRGANQVLGDALMNEEQKNGG